MRLWRRRGWFVLALLAAVALILAIPALGRPLTTEDEAILLTYAEQARSGLVPHRDFFTVYGPVPFYLLAGLFDLLGSSLGTERLLGLAFHLGIAAGCYLSGQARDRRVALAAALASLLLMVPLGAAAYAWLGAMACLTLALGLVWRARPWQCFAAGCLAALASGFRPELLVVGVAVIAPFAWRASGWRVLVAGWIVGLTPLAALVAFAGERVWRNVVLGRIGVNGTLRVADDPFRSLAIAAAVLLMVAVLVMSFWQRRTRLGASSALFAAGITPQAFQRLDGDHAFYVLCVMVPLVIINTPPIADLLRRRSRALTISALALVTAVASVGLAQGAPASSVVRVGDRSLRLTVDDAAALRSTRAALLHAARPGATLFVGSTDMSRMALARTELYYLLPEFRARAYYLELAVGVSERAGSGLATDVHDADVLLLTPMPADLRRRLYPYLEPGSAEANEVVRREFCLVAHTGWGLVYEHRACPGGTELAGVQPVES